MSAGMIVACVLGVLGFVGLRLHRRQPFEGGPLLLLRWMLGIGVTALLLLALGGLLGSGAQSPQAAAALGGLLSWGALTVRGGNRGPGPVRADTRPASAGWRVVGAARATPAAPRRGGYSGPSPTVRSIEGMEVQS